MTPPASGRVVISQLDLQAVASSLPLFCLLPSSTLLPSSLLFGLVELQYSRRTSHWPSSRSERPPPRPLHRDPVSWGERWRERPPRRVHHVRPLEKRSSWSAIGSTPPHPRRVRSSIRRLAESWSWRLPRRASDPVVEISSDWNRSDRHSYQIE